MSLFFLKCRRVEVAGHKIAKASVQCTAGRWPLPGQISKMLVTETVVTKFTAQLTLVVCCDEFLSTLATLITVVASAAVIVYGGCGDILRGVVVSCDVTDEIVDVGHSFWRVFSVTREIVTTDEIWTCTKSIIRVWYAVLMVQVLMRARSGIDTGIMDSNMSSNARAMSVFTFFSASFDMGVVVNISAMRLSHGREEWATVVKSFHFIVGWYRNGRDLRLPCEISHDVIGGPMLKTRICVGA